MPRHRARPQFFSHCMAQDGNKRECLPPPRCLVCAGRHRLCRQRALCDPGCRNVCHYAITRIQQRQRALDARYLPSARQQRCCRGCCTGRAPGKTPTQCPQVAGEAIRCCAYPARARPSGQAHRGPTLHRYAGGAAPVRQFCAAHRLLSCETSSKDKTQSRLRRHETLLPLHAHCPGVRTLMHPTAEA